MRVSKDFLEKVEMDSCVPYRDSEVVCLTEDLPGSDNVPVQLEVDREGGNVLLRHVILDREDNPLYVEYFIDRNFLESISSIKTVSILFVNVEGDIRKRFSIPLSDEDIRLIRSEMRIGS